MQGPSGVFIWAWSLLSWVSQETWPLVATPTQIIHTHKLHDDEVSGDSLSSPLPHLVEMDEHVEGARSTVQGSGVISWVPPGR